MSGFVTHFYIVWSFSKHLCFSFLPPSPPPQRFEERRCLLPACLESLSNIYITELSRGGRRSHTRHFAPESTPSLLVFLGSSCTNTYALHVLHENYFCWSFLLFTVKAVIYLDSMLKIKPSTPINLFHIHFHFYTNNMNRKILNASEQRKNIEPFYFHCQV